jgi:peroxiredoxin
MKHPAVEAFGGLSSQSSPGRLLQMWMPGPREAGTRLPVLASVLDDDELLVVQRVREIDVERKRKAQKPHREKMEAGRKPLMGAEAPEISASQWLNSSRRINLKELKGKPVLVYFEDPSFHYSTENLASLQEVNEQYAARGLTVIGVLPSRAAERLPGLIKHMKLTFPIAVDDGHTVDRFCVTDLPSYFFIDREGKLVGAEYADFFRKIAVPVPNAKAIEDLLEDGKQINGRDR